MAHDEPPHHDLRCLQIQLFSSLVLKELMTSCLFALRSPSKNGIYYYKKEFASSAVDKGGKNETGRVTSIKVYLFTLHLPPNSV